MERCLFVPKFTGWTFVFSKYTGAWAIRSGVTVDRRVQAVIDYMLEDLSRPLRLEEIAHTVNLSVSRLQHLFKADTNKTAAQYLKSLRMQMAKQLIDSTFLNTKEIMQRVGMNDESHFVREFKKIYGLPPGSYKRRLPPPRINTADSANK
ncbi:MAG TPA: AraC family transcriptional regulator [Pyrinomonadaceae bacterium]